MPSFFDRVRETATDLGNQAQRGIDQGQAKLDERGMRRDCDHLAKQIGYLVWRGRTSGAGATDEAEIDRLCAQLTAREADIAAVHERAAAAQPQPAAQWGQQGAPPQAPGQQGQWGQQGAWGAPPQAPGQAPWGAQPPGQPPGQPPAAPPAPGQWGAPAGTAKEADDLPEAPSWG